jgi:glycerol-1-phosphate dehydrogenase [NAD(P)+]
MYVDISRKDGQLLLENFNCTCENDHLMPDMDIYIKPNMIDDCASCITKRGLGKNVLIIADETTYDVAAAAVEAALTAAGFPCRMCVLRGDRVEPSPERSAEIQAVIDNDTELLLSVGSGVITDLTRYTALKSDLPFAVFGTAASMDGYTSVTSSMLIDGMKLSVYGKPAELLMFDPGILASAPLPMQASGVGDMLAKYNVIVDWKLGSVVKGEIYCPLCDQLLTTALALCHDNVDEIAARTPQGMDALIESLILAGLSGLIIGSTRPVSSIDHNMSHYWEMTSLVWGGTAPSHGISVGIGLIYALMMHDTLRSADLSKIDKEKIKAARMSKEEKRAFMQSYYPPGVGDSAMEINEDWYLDWPEHEARIDRLVAYHEQYKKDCEILPSYREIADILAKLGAPTSATKAGISKERLRDTLICTKDFRPRYNIGKSLSKLGLLDECIEKIMAAEDDL